MALPFSAEEFFDLFKAYNQALWPAALALWMCAAIGALLLARGVRHRALAVMLAVQWAWAGVAYHFAFFTSINPAAWLFGALFLIEAGLLAWFGVVRSRLHFAPGGSPRKILAWTLIGYALLYPAITLLEGHAYPKTPTFGLPCPTTLLTIGFLLAAVPPWPRIVAAIPIIWAIVAGSAAVLLGVRADFMLWPAAGTLAAAILVPAHVTPRASGASR